MKKIIYALILFVCGIGCFSCQETDYPTFDDSVIDIYFTKDSINYSFGITPMNTTTYIVDIPVKIMGAPVPTARSFKVEVIAEKTNAETPQHYQLPDQLTLTADSVNGTLPLQIFRDQLGETEWSVAFRLVANDYFTPAPHAGKELGSEVIITFNNIVSKPNWKDWAGDFGWPEYKFGPWNPVVYVAFMDFFRQLQTKASSTYRNMVGKYGENLDNEYSGWDWDYDYTMTKYVLIPMYEYFETHPELGVTDFPNPNA